MKRVIVTHALPSECVDLALPGYEVVRLVTGYGKVNSCVKLIECLDDGSADLVLNVGTAGISAYHIGDILLCTSFVDRDLESTLLPGVEFNLQIPVDSLPPGLLAWESIVDGKPLLRRYTVNTGDNFVRDVVYMRAMLSIWKRMPRHKSA